MNASRFIIPIIALSIVTLSCRKHYSIEDRARKQVEISLSSELRSLVPEIDMVSMTDLETVYANDSICLLQLVARYGIKGVAEYEEDLQYVYYLDMMLSRAARRNIFVEEFRRVPRLSEEEIRDSYRKVRRSGENVYDRYVGNGCPVKIPYDR